MSEGGWMSECAVLGGAGQTEDPGAAPGLPHHGALCHRLMDFFHRAA